MAYTLFSAETNSKIPDPSDCRQRSMGKVTKMTGSVFQEMNEEGMRGLPYLQCKASGERLLLLYHLTLDGI